MENFQEQRHIWKGSPVLPVGMFKTEMCVPVVQSHLWYQLQAFALVFRPMELICANGKRESGTKFTSPKSCLPSTQNRQPTDGFAHENDKNQSSLDSLLRHSLQLTTRAVNHLKKLPVTCYSPIRRQRNKLKKESKSLQFVHHLKWKQNLVRREVEDVVYWTAFI